MKPEYHQSRLKHYLKCPQMFRLSTEQKPRISKSLLDAMRDGNLFEGFAFGFKSETGEKSENELIGQKKPVSLDPIRIHAKKVKTLFKSGESFVKLEKEFDEYILAGEADHIGELNWDLIKEFYPDAKAEGETINDLKYSGSLDYGAFTKNDFIDNFQALMYVGIHYFITGDLLPFIYIIVENEYLNPIIKITKVEVTVSDIENKLLPFVNMVHNDLFYQANPGYETCLGGRRGSRCWYLDNCTDGRKFTGGYSVTEIGDFQ